MKRTILFLLFGTLFLFVSCSAGGFKKAEKLDVLVVGGGASGTMAGIQAARLGAKTLIAEEGPWLGGMLTSAGVSAIDGNQYLSSGLWDEFRQGLYDYYGGPEGVKTGWVSNVLFEPSVGDKLLKDMTQKEENLEVRFGSKLLSLEKNKTGWLVQFSRGEEHFSIQASILIDGTELGDVAKRAGVSYDVGMDSQLITHEEIAPLEANDIIQDLTYVVILKNYGKGTDKTISRPEHYDPSEFYCTCAGRCDQDTVKRKLWPCGHMLEYGHLPNDKFMINWPFYANDYYVNAIDLSPAQRDSAFARAKLHTLRYLYYIQNELGYKNLGIADDEFPTPDGLPFFPYHRESRRIHGEVRFTVNDLSKPFDQPTALYRTGIAVGDYPIDHHHDAYPDQTKVPNLYFFPVPSYCLPMGTLIPREVKDLIVAEKSISVTNVVNGTTRLQPVALLIGQASGVLAALAAEEGVSPSQVPVREVQEALLEAGAYILPYFDVQPVDPCFKAIQRIGATGIIKGEGKNVGWANRTLFYPDSVMTSEALVQGLKDIAPNFSFAFKGEVVTVNEALEAALELAVQCGVSTSDVDVDKRAVELWKINNFGIINADKPVSRRQVAVIFDDVAHPFESVPVDLEGRFKF